MKYCSRAKVSFLLEALEGAEVDPVPGRVQKSFLSVSDTEALWTLVWDSEKIAPAILNF